MKLTRIGKELTMKTLNTIAAAAVALAVAVPAFAGSTQVVAGNGYTLTQAAAIKFNNDTRQDDRQTVSVVPGSGGNASQLAAVAGLSADEAQGMSLGEIYVAKINREARGDDKQAVKSTGAVMSTRSAYGAGAQLVASAGLSADEASDLSLTEIAAAKFDRDTHPNR
jgi:hypothetical protein